MPPSVEVLVVSYGSAAYVERLLRSLDRVAPKLPVAIREHSADPGARAEIERLAQANGARVRVDHDPSNPGFGVGCNALADSSEADYLLFLNPDTELVTWPWSDDHPPPGGAVVGPLMVESGPPSEHYGTRYRIRDEVARSWLRRRPDRPTGRGYVSGAALLIERSAFDRVGGFDPAFFLFYEDIDLCLRANAAGGRTVVDDRWTMRHSRRHSTDANFAAALQWSYQSAVHFHGKHGSPVGVYRAYVVIDSALRAGWHLVRGRRQKARAYAALAAQAIRPTH